MENVDRRKLLKKSIITLGAIGAIANKPFGLQASEVSCLVTKEQPEGPFYPIKDQLDKDNDLTYVHSNNQIALGEIIILKGVVNNINCNPIQNALVEIWQACESGKYNHPGDPNPAKLDPNFQYFGRCLTNEKGEFIFKTIKPGLYKANENWVRPPHIHMKIHLRGFEELTTQIYFQEDKNLNDKDLILQRLDASSKKQVIIDFKKQNDSIYRIGNVNLTLNRI